MGPRKRERTPVGLQTWQLTPAGGVSTVPTFGPRTRYAARLSAKRYRFSPDGNALHRTPGAFRGARRFLLTHSRSQFYSC